MVAAVGVGGYFLWNRFGARAAPSSGGNHPSPPAYTLPTTPTLPAWPTYNPPSYTPGYTPQVPAQPPTQPTQPTPPEQTSEGGGGIDWGSIFGTVASIGGQLLNSWNGISPDTSFGLGQITPDPMPSQGGGMSLIPSTGGGQFSDYDFGGGNSLQNIGSIGIGF